MSLGFTFDGPKLYEVRTMIWSNLGDCIPFQIAAGSTTTSVVLDRPIPGATGDYKMAELWFPTIGDARRITNSTFTSNIPTFTVAPALTSAGAGSIGEIHKVYTKDAMDQALKRAYVELFNWGLVDMVSDPTALTGSGTTSEYTLPQPTLSSLSFPFIGVHMVEVQKADGHYYALRPADWEIISVPTQFAASYAPTATKLKLSLDVLNQVDGRPLRIRGYRNPHISDTEGENGTNARFEGWVPYLIASATLHLLSGPVENPTMDTQSKFQYMQYWQAVKDREYANARVLPQANTKWVAN